MSDLRVRIVTYPELASTNTTAAQMGDEAAHGDVIRAVAQTAGRGQRGNSWESEPGKNATFSLVLRPVTWPAQRQFELSMAVSLAICRELDDILNTPGSVKVKWPNDIYVGDKKLCGILIENVLTGIKIERMIIGAGINLNQTQFVSDAPNPVSLKQISGADYDVEGVVRAVCARIVSEVESYISQPDSERLSAEYHARLWRNDGRLYRWLDTASGTIFEASIQGVAATGMFTVCASDGCRTFAFKEIQAVL